MVRYIVVVCVLGGALGGVAVMARADEGMWLFNNPPVKQLKDRYDFDVTPAWMERLQLAAVRFNSGGSGSFVSSEGLVMTNHHVGADALQKLSTADNDLLAKGFRAASRDEELKCVDLELNVLMNIEDVTDKINAAVKPGMDAAAAYAARRAAMNRIEKESLDATGLRSDVVTLYQGGLYHLYRFKKYTDVRLVFAPEQSIAFFGGDPDNFEYPRYDLDVCFFRVYENGKPARPPQFLGWSAKGVAEGDLVFVAGHPGRTDRQNTMKHLEFLRDRAIPQTMRKLCRWEVLLGNYSERTDENARRAKDDLFGIKNSRKARLGGLEGLQDPAILRAKAADEAALRKAFAEVAKSAKIKGDPWAEVAAAIAAWEKILTRYDLLEGGSGFRCESFAIARGLLRLAAESEKPNAERLREYRESNLASLKQQLFSEAPIYDDLEQLKLADALSYLAEMLGFDDPLVQKALAGKSPQQRAAELIAGTKVKDPTVRKKLSEGGLKAIEAAHDPMIELAMLIDPESRKLRKEYEANVEEPLRQAYAKIAKARFAMSGASVYPDATFTLRLAFGQVKGYDENGRRRPPWTTIGGAFAWSAEHHNHPPFELPASWLKAKDRLDLETPLNFVSTADIIGGNSGSPVVNRKGEVVGLIFDGNLSSLVWDFVFNDATGRALAVDCRGIVEALRKVYSAGALADELGK